MEAWTELQTVMMIDEIETRRGMCVSLVDVSPPCYVGKKEDVRGNFDVLLMGFEVEEPQSMRDWVAAGE